MPPSKKRKQNLAKGCVLCHEGAKMVLFVTGRCPRSCWYCPLSRDRKGKDAVFANETPVADAGQVIAEAKAMNALGTGITGGEPLLRMDRMTEYCRVLKDRFGPDHHIHLYTAKAPLDGELFQLAGLVDEIRLHPPHEFWEGILTSPYIASAKRAREMGFDIGIEVPALPGLDHLAPALPYLDFFNINELEWGGENADEMRRRGLVPEDITGNAISGARVWAEELCRHEKVHWCSSAFKDSVQLRERLKRIAKNTARPFDEVTSDGTVVYGVLEASSRDRELCSRLCTQAMDAGGFEELGGTYEMAWWVLSKYAGNLSGKKYVVERYPNRGMVVEVTPL